MNIINLLGFELLKEFYGSNPHFGNI